MEEIKYFKSSLSIVTILLISIFLIFGIMFFVAGIMSIIVKSIFVAIFSFFMAIQMFFGVYYNGYKSYYKDLVAIKNKSIIIPTDLCYPYPKLYNNTFFYYKGKGEDEPHRIGYKFTKKK